MPAMNEYSDSVAAQSAARGNVMTDTQNTEGMSELTKGATSRSCSRRQFLRMAGLSGAGLGLSAGLGGLLAACGEETTTTTTSAGTTSSVASSTTTVSSGPETGDELRVGMVSTLTGSLAAFAGPDRYLVDRWKDIAADGIVCGDGKKHPISILVEDSQSNTNRAAQVTGDLIQNSRVNLMVAGCSQDTTYPLADQCEAMGAPSFTCDSIWEPWFFQRGGDPAVGFKWNYHVFFSIADSFTMYFAMWDKIPNNKTYGALWPNDAGGIAYRNAWPDLLAEKGWKLIDPGAFQPGTEDYTAVITALKQGGAEVCAGITSPPDFTNFWTQARQQGYRPKICSIGIALNFPEAANALGDSAVGLTAPTYWMPSFPYKSSLTGETCRELADDFEATAERQWNQSLYHYCLIEVAVDTFKRATDPTKAESVLEALRTTKLDTIVGPIDFTAPVEAGTNHPNINCCRTPVVGSQWIKGTKWPYDMVVVSNTPFMDVPIEADMIVLQ